MMQIKIYLTYGFLVALVLGMIPSSLNFSNPNPVQAQVSEILVGGRFLPGVYDIFTPTTCGATVSVAGPKSGVFTFYPVKIYLFFLTVPEHVGTHVLGKAKQLSICPPALYMFGSSATP